ncbi:glycosyltransferase family 2 protein [Vagococcus zengguangii]|uniref:Glycosyltransferase n=1 Tax=Vagococcus zengguangii TaxID=2571750 RepID=A0A4D7CV33_9ENTE|nr:glycosyltransferase [Vagococcus zengguangii]QCI87204.1 glycosyltransferase [Vagococcus zengguangii]TLG80708.1 glycosyltransferase [Vagococcus zengguangii]
MFKEVGEFLFTVLSLYPILGAMFLVVGVLCYKFLYQHEIQEFQRIAPEEQPMVTIMIPAHNEEVMIEQTIHYLMNELLYQNYEILVMDDGSTDQTPAILARLSAQYEKLRVVRVEANKGKAHAFNLGLSFAKGEYILSNDADTVPEVDALNKYMNYFLSEEGRNIAAVTANMDVQNRDRLIEKSQTVEFSSIVGTIKRAQMGMLGSMYSYSGANTMYRKAALIDVGLFRQDRATEDISICWDHQFFGWRAVFAPEIMFFMNVPSSLEMLYLQRKRWAKGGTEVWLTNFKRVFSNPIKNLPKVVLFIDQTLSIVWSLFYVVSMFIFSFTLMYYLATGNTERIQHMFAMAFIFITMEMFSGIIQLIASLILDNKGRKFKYLIFAPFYMILYWQMNAITITTTFIPAVKTILGFGSGTWKSPERVQMISTNND